MTQPKPATVARIYHYLLGGTHYFPADRTVAEALLTLHPDTARIARANRAFLNRAVGYLAGRGVRRFLDIGCGLPAHPNVHDITDTLTDDSRVVYVDVDPVAVSQYQELLDKHPRASAIYGDLTHPHAILNHPQTRRMLTPGEPIAVLLTAVLHHLPDHTVYPAVAHLTTNLPAGSYLVISHASPHSDNHLDSAQIDEAKRIYQQHTGMRLHPRTATAIAQFLHDIDLIDPGLVWAPHWRPDPTDPPAPAIPGIIAGIGRIRSLKPGSTTAKQLIDQPFGRHGRRN